MPGVNRIKSGIYCIRCVPTGKVYVGSAAKVSLRWAHHRRRLLLGLHDNPYLQRAHDKYGADAFEYTILEEVEDKATLAEREQFHIDRLKATDRRIGFNIRLIATSNLGLKMTDEQREKIRRGNTGKKFSDQHREKIRAVKTGIRCSDETRAKMSESHKRIGISDETRAKMAASSRGKKKSPEHVAKVIASNMGRICSDETRARMRASHIGKKHTEVTKDRMRESRRRRKHGRETQGLLFS